MLFSAYAQLAIRNTSINNLWRKEKILGSFPDHFTFPNFPINGYDHIHDIKVRELFSFNGVTVKSMAIVVMDSEMTTAPLVATRATTLHG